MTEQGFVREIHGGLAMVETVQTEACSHCSAKGACQMMGGEKMRLVPAINEAGAQEGDRVLVAAKRKTVLGAGFLVYMGPVITLILGAALGKAYGPDYGYDAQTAAVVLGLSSLALCWFLVSRLSKRLAGSEHLAVKVVRVIAKAENGGPDAVDQCAVGV